MKILIVDDHPVFRNGLKDILEKNEGVKVIGEADNGDSALFMIKALNPDIIFLDLSMPQMNGFQVLEKLGEIESQTFKVIVMTSYSELVYLEKAMELGADAYILKDDTEQIIRNCLEVVNVGEHFISPNVSPDKKSDYLNMPTTEDANEILSQLTQTELKVMSFLADFLTSKEIARKMFISFRTVQNHRRNIKQKLDLSGMHQLTKLAQKYKNDIIKKLH